MDNEEVKEQTWVYLDTKESGIIIDVDDMRKYAARGYVDSPDNYVKPSVPADQPKKRGRPYKVKD